MELSLSNTLLAGDSLLIDHIVGEVKSQGIFDQFRKECIADVDTKPAYQNLRTRVEGSVNSFLNKQIWKPDLNKNQLRETLRKHIHDAPYLDAGVERIVDQVVNPKVYSVFMSQIEDVVYKFLGIERPKTKEKLGACGLKDLLPKDLDPVSPESDKNSLKDLSLESVDTNDNLDAKQDNKVYDEHMLQDEEVCANKEKNAPENGHILFEEKIADDTCKTFNKIGNNNLNLNTSGKSDDKIDEDEEDSPIFEPIDIMNLNESNISNDSHLSGISELTSHRSQSPDLSNELSRDNFDYSNQDSQLSKVSSDSRLSIVTDFGSSNHGLTPVYDASKDEISKDKYEAKNSKDNFKEIREFDSSKNKMVKNFEFGKTKDYKDLKEIKNTKNISCKENSRDAVAVDSSTKDKYSSEHKISREKNKDSESMKSKSIKEKIKSSKNIRYKDRSNEKRESSHSSVKYDKHNKNKSKDKIDQVKESSEKIKDISENLKEDKLKNEKLKEMDRKDNISKEAKDLKDLYKEKIRELREKKELTEKEKMNKDKYKFDKGIKDRKSSSKDKKKEHRSSSSSLSKNISVSCQEDKGNKMLTVKITNRKDKISDSKDKIKQDEKRLSKDSKNKIHLNSRTAELDKSDKSDVKKIRNEKEDKLKIDIKKDIKANIEKTNGKKDVKNHTQNKNSCRDEKLDNKKDSKNDSQSKDKKRKEDKKSKAKDDHSSLRKNSNDRRSTDRDGSNGSNSKTSQTNNSNSNVISQKSNSSSFTKENQINNSNSETSDSIEKTQANDVKLHESNYKLSSNKIDLQMSASNWKIDDSNEVHDKRRKTNQTNLSSGKKQLSDEERDKSNFGATKIKKPKFAKNVHEAKKLMKIRKQIERQKVKEDKKTEKGTSQEMGQTNQSNIIEDIDNLASMPDDERVQIIEIPDEEYEEPYPENEFNLTLEERSIIMLGADFRNAKPLSDMESCIKESLSEIVSNVPIRTTEVTRNPQTQEKIVHSDDLRGKFSIVSSDMYVSPENIDNSRAMKEEYEKNSNIGCKSKTLKDTVVNAKQFSNNLQEKKTSVLSDREERIVEDSKCTIRYEDINVKQSTGKNTKTQDYSRAEQQNNKAEIHDKAHSINSAELQNNMESRNKNVENMMDIFSKTDEIDSQNDCTKARPSSVSDDNEDCRYFKIDNKKLERFHSFLESIELTESLSLEDIIESLGGKIVSSKFIAPPLSKLKHSSSPLSDISRNNSNNNNDNCHKRTLSSPTNEDVHNVKKKKSLVTKKLKFPSLYNTQSIPNGENFIMPLSPDSDVSATSEKMASTIIKEEKSRNRSNQRYSSDDLYKPRPLFSSSSRRSRRSNQA